MAALLPLVAWRPPRMWSLSTAPPEDPLGPVGQDPDVVRAEACRLVSSDQSVCSAPKPPKPPDVDGGSGLDLSFLSLLLWVVLIAGVAWLVYLLVRWAAAKGGFAAKRRATDAGDSAGADIIEDDTVVVDRSREPFSWRDEADKHRRAGRYRDAVRCRYRALVGDLARRGLVDEIPGRTTGEERAQMRRSQPAASRPFTAAADLFDGAWFGHYEVAAADDDRFQGLEREVLAASEVARR